MLTFFKPIPEGARAAHGSALLIQGHGAIPEAAVGVRVILPIGIGEAVGPQHGWVGQAHLGDSGGTRWNKRNRIKRLGIHVFVQILDGDEEETARYQPSPSSPTSLSCLFSKRWSHQHLSYTPRAKNKGGEVGQFQSRALGLSFPTWHVQTGSCHLPGMS